VFHPSIKLIKAISDFYKNRLSITYSKRLSGIPHFNPDLDNALPPEAVVDFRYQLMVADCVLICPPEYAMGVPGSLKNGVDWTVSSMEFARKPTVLITASTSGERGHASLMETLKVIEAEIPEEMQLLISHVKTKVIGTTITNAVTQERVPNVIEALLRRIRPDSNRA